MGFDTMGSYQRLMLATYMHDEEDHLTSDDDDGSDHDLVRTDSLQFTDDSQQQCSQLFGDERVDVNSPTLTLSKPQDIPLSPPSFKEVTAIWSPPRSPRSKSSESSPTMMFRDSATSFAEVSPTTPGSAKEKNALATKLYAAACSGDLDTIKLMLSLGVPIDSATLVPGLFEAFKPPKAGHLSPLAGAACFGQLDVLKLLVANGALINPNCNQSASSPLHQACRWNDVHAVRYLLDVGADVNNLNSFNTTVLMYAVKYCTPEIVALILSHKPDLDQLSFIGISALHTAIWPYNLCQFENTELLLHAGADPNATMLDGNSALHMAALSDSASIIRCLLKHGANPQVRNAENKTPLETAKEAGSEKSVRILEDAMIMK